MTSPGVTEHEGQSICSRVADGKQMLAFTWIPVQLNLIQRGSGYGHVS